MSADCRLYQFGGLSFGGCRLTVIVSADCRTTVKCIFQASENDEAYSYFFIVNWKLEFDKWRDSWFRLICEFICIRQSNSVVLITVITVRVHGCNGRNVNESYEYLLNYLIPKWLIYNLNLHGHNEQIFKSSRVPWLLHRVILHFQVKWTVLIKFFLRSVKKLITSFPVCSCW